MSDPYGQPSYRGQPPYQDPPPHPGQQPPHQGQPPHPGQQPPQPYQDPDRPSWGTSQSWPPPGADQGQPAVPPPPPPPPPPWAGPGTAPAPTSDGRSRKARKAERKAARAAGPDSAAAHRRGFPGGRLGTGVAALVLVGLTVVVTLLVTGDLLGTDLDRSAVQRGVQTVLRDDYGIGSVSQVSCPSGISADKGTRFDCRVKIGSLDQTVPVTVLNDEGQYQVGAPG